MHWSKEVAKYLSLNRSVVLQNLAHLMHRNPMLWSNNIIAHTELTSILKILQNLKDS